MSSSTVCEIGIQKDAFRLSDVVPYTLGTVVSTS